MIKYEYQIEFYTCDTTFKPNSTEKWITIWSQIPWQSTLTTLKGDGQQIINKYKEIKQWERQRSHPVKNVRLLRRPVYDWEEIDENGRALP